MESNSQLNRIEADLDILKCDLILIQKALKGLLACKKQDEITFNVEGDKLIGAFDSYQKRQFRAKND